MTLPAQRPEAGQDADVVRTVPLAIDLPPEPHAAVETDAVFMVLPLARLHAIVASDPIDWCTEAERLAVIAAARARAWLDALNVQPHYAGDRVARLDAMGDAAHLLVQEMESGHVVVIDRPHGQPTPSVQIRYRGTRIAADAGRGEIEIGFGDDRPPFFRVDWWVA